MIINGNIILILINERYMEIYFIFSPNTGNEPEKTLYWGAFHVVPWTINVYVFGKHGCQLLVRNVCL